MIEKYVHHDVEVSVFSHLKGKHRDHCLCFANCAEFKPNTPENCKIAQANFEICKKYNITAPVFECPKYHAKDN